jgi:amino acid adenylation domain-containing protein
MDKLKERMERLSPAKRRLLQSRMHKRPSRSAPAHIKRTPKDRPAPASFGQQRLWFIDHFEEGLVAYNNAYRIELPGRRLDPRWVRCSLDEIMRRHEPLRTRFSLDGGRLVQVVEPTPEFDLPEMDLGGLLGDAQRTEVGRWARELARQPFDLALGSPLRAALVHPVVKSSVLILVVHHLAIDRWSLGILLREFAALYESFAAGSRYALKELPIRYADFATWQSHWYSDQQRVEQEVEFWRQHLAESPPMLRLAGDRPRAERKSYAGARVQAVVAEELKETLNRCASNHGATLFMVLLAAFKVLLYRITGQSDIIVGTPIAGRRQVELEQLIGLFLNTLAIRTDLSHSPTFVDLLERVKNTCVQSYAHADLPFEKLIAELKLERQRNLSPIFQVWFNYHNVPMAKPEMDGVPLTVEDIDTGTSKFDFAVTIRKRPQGLIVQAEYDTDLFTASTAQRLLEQYCVLLEEIARRPQATIDGFSLLRPGDAELLPDPTAELSDQWNGAMHQHLAAHARNFPQDLAVCDVEVSWNYRELHQRSRQVACYLRAQGVETGDIIAIYAHRDAFLVQAILGVLAAGAAYAILDPAYPPARMLACLELIRPRGVIAIRSAGKIPPTVSKGIAELSARVFLTLPESSFDSSLDSSPTDDLEDGSEVVVGADDIACITFTSGSTGQPKAVLGRHGSLSHFLPWMRQRFALDSSDRIGMLSALAHDPLQRDLFTPLQLGATLSIPPPELFEAPSRLVDWMRSEAITICHLTPALAQLLTGGEPSGELVALRHAFLVGDVLTDGDVSRLRRLAPGLNCVNLYGSTETQRAVGYFVVPCSVAGGEEVGAGDALPEEAGNDPARGFPLGRGMPGSQLLVLNRALELAGIGEVGEIYLRSPHLARGYLGDEELTAQRFLADPWPTRNPGGGMPSARLYRTGDLGAYLPDGNVIFRGRVDHQVKIRGFRVELGEIEAVLLSHELIREAVVLASTGPRGDRQLAAFVVGTVSTLALRRFLRERLPKFMIPARFVPLQALLRTPTRKVDRRALGRLHILGRSASTEATLVLPKTPMESLISTIWCVELGIKKLSVHDNFFDLGGHSLQSVVVIDKLQRKLEVQILLRDLYLQTLGQLATSLDAAVADRLLDGPKKERYTS